MSYRVAWMDMRCRWLKWLVLFLKKGVFHRFMVLGQKLIHIYTQYIIIFITLLLSFLYLIIKGKDEKMKGGEIKG